MPQINPKRLAPREQESDLVKRLRRFETALKQLSGITNSQYLKLIDASESDATVRRTLGEESAYRSALDKLYKIFPEIKPSGR